MCFYLNDKVPGKFNMQDDLIQLLEIALTDKAIKASAVVLPDFSNLEELVPLDTVQSSSDSLGYGTQCNVRGTYITDLFSLY